MSYASSFTATLPPSTLQIVSTSDHQQRTEYDMLKFLATVQAVQVQILSISWQHGRDPIGQGGTARVLETPVNVNTSLAFKHVAYQLVATQPNNHASTQYGLDSYQLLMDAVSALPESQVFRLLTVEVVALLHPIIRRHPNIAQLQGICFEVSPSDQRPWPVLVFEKSSLGDLLSFLASPVGRATGMDARIRLCADVVWALAYMHIHGILHGDIKPENVLVFPESDGQGYNARVTDFGFSTLQLSEQASCRLKLPLSRPWNAPEHDRLSREWTRTEAMRADIFSLSMLCLWILFEPYLMGAKSVIEDIKQFCLDLEGLEAAMENINDLKLDGTLPVVAQRLLELEGGSLDQGQRDALTNFFELGLSTDPLDRDRVDLQEFLRGVQPTWIREMSPRHDLTRDLSLQVSASDFKIEHNFQSFHRCDYRLRSHIAHCIRDRYQTNPAEFRVQLALCYYTGFGFVRDESRAESILQGSNLKVQDLQDILRQGLENERYRATEWFYNLSQSGSVGIEAQAFANIYLEHRKLAEAEAYLNQERRDLTAVLGAHSNPVNDVSQALSAVYMAQSMFKEAELLTKEVYQMIQREKGGESQLTLKIMGQLAGLYLVQERWLEALTLQEQVVEKLYTMLGDESEEVLQAWSVLALIYSSLGRVDECEGLQRQVLETSTKVLGPEHEYTLASMCNLANTYCEAGREEEAISLQERTLETYRQILPAGHPDVLMAMRNLAVMYSKVDQWDDAEALLSKALADTQAIFGERHRNALLCLGSLAVVYRGRDRVEDAEALQIQILQARKDLLGDDHTETIASKQSLVLTYKEQRRWQEAERLQEEAVETQGKIMKPEHPLAMEGIVKLAIIYWNRRRLADANELLNRILDIRVKVFKEDDLRTLHVMELLATTMRSEGRSKTAESLLAQVVDKRRAKQGEKAPTTLKSMSELAWAYWVQKRWQDAEELHSKVLEARREMWGEEHHLTLNSESGLAAALAGQERWDEAEGLWIRVIEKGERVWGAKHFRLVDCRERLAKMYLKQKRWQEAAELYQSVARDRSAAAVVEPRDMRSARVGLAWAYMGQGRGVEATVLLKQAMEEESEDHQPALLQRNYRHLAENLRR